MEFTATTPLIFEATNSQHPVTIANVYGLGWLVKTTFDEYSGFENFNAARRYAATIVPFSIKVGPVIEETV